MQPLKNQQLCFVEDKVQISSVSKYRFPVCPICLSGLSSLSTHSSPVSAFNLCPPTRSSEFLPTYGFSVWGLDPQNTGSLTVTLHSVLPCSAQMSERPRRFKHFPAHRAIAMMVEWVDFASRHQLKFLGAYFRTSVLRFEMWLLIKPLKLYTTTIREWLKIRAGWKVL